MVSWSESTHRTASQLIQPFCTAHGRRSLYFTTGRPFSLQNCPFALGDMYPRLLHSFLGPPESTFQTTCRSVQPFLQGSRCDRDTDRQTDWPTDWQIVNPHRLGNNEITVPLCIGVSRNCIQCIHLFSPWDWWGPSPGTQAPRHPFWLRRRSIGVPYRWCTCLERSSLWRYVCPLAGRFWTAFKDRTFSPLLQRCLTYFFHSYSGPWNGLSI